MIGPIVLPPQNPETQRSETPLLQLGLRSNQRMDPLSEVLALMKPQLYVAGGFAVLGDMAIHFPKHQGIKCYAMLAGQCWLVVDGVPEPVLLHAGDCFLLPRGLPFRLATDLSLEPVLYTDAFARLGTRSEAAGVTEGARYIAGGHFALTGGHSEMILHSLPPIVHIRRESDKAAMRWSLERMREELSDPQPGSSLIAQQLAYMMLMQSLAERVGMSRSVFALRFRETVGATPMEYLTRWRMLLAADRLKNSSDGLSAISQSLGYESESAFGKAFRRIMGCSPRQYTRSTAPCAIPVKHSAEDHEPELVVTG